MPWEEKHKPWRNFKLTSWRSERLSRHRVAETALLEKTAKLTPPSTSVAPKGAGSPGDTSNLLSFGLSTTAVSACAPAASLPALTTTVRLIILSSPERVETPSFCRRRADVNLRVRHCRISPRLKPKAGMEGEQKLPQRLSSMLRLSSIWRIREPTWKRTVSVLSSEEADLTRYLECVDLAWESRHQKERTSQAGFSS